MDNGNKEVLEKLAEISQDLKALRNSLHSAFVKDDNGDPDFVGHRQFHRLKIDEARAANGVKEDVTKKVVGWASVSGISIIFYALWDYIKTHMR